MKYHPTPRDILRILPYYKIATNQILEGILGNYYRGFLVYPKQGKIWVRVYLHPHTPSEIYNSAVARCENLGKAYHLPEIRLYKDTSKQISAKGIYLDLLSLYDKRKNQGRKQNYYSMVRYKTLPFNCRGCIVEISGKKGMRTTRVRAASGKILRGTESDKLDCYKGQILDKRGTIGVKVVLLKNLPPKLLPTLKVEKRYTPEKTRPYYSRYYHD